MMNKESKVTKIEKILLINPFLFNNKNRNIGIDPVVSRHAGQEIKTGMTFPIGLAYIGAVLSKAGYGVRILDPIAETVPFDKIYKDSEWADAIITPFSPAHQDHTKRYLNDFKHKLRILCGSIAQHISEHLFEKDFAEVILKGEPEETIVELVKQYSDISSVKGIIWHSGNGKPIENEDRPPVQDLDSLPFPLRDFNDPSNYWDISFHTQPTAWILPTRGCPFNCIFCAQYGINHKKVRRRSPKNIVDEIEEIVKKHNVRNFAFFDETFNANPEFTINVCDEIINRELKISWYCSARPDLVRGDVVRKMKKSGCIEMRFGLESANDEILEYLRKDTSVRKIRKGIEITKKAGMNFSLQCIFGSPMESEKTINNTLRFIKKIRPLFVSFNVLTPLPGSYLFEQIKDKLDLVNGLKNFDILHTDYQLGKYSSDELASIIRKAYKSYYMSPVFFSRILEELFKSPKRGFFITKTLLIQARYMYKSILSNN